MELRIQDGKIKADAIKTHTGPAGEVVFGATGEDADGNPIGGFRFKVTNWSAETRTRIPAEAN